MALSGEKLINIGRVIVASGEVDALILHGLGRAGVVRNEASVGWKTWLALEKKVMRGYDRLQQEFRKPVILGSHHSLLESQAISDLQGEGIRVLNRLDEIAQVLFRMYEYWRKIPERE
jgi:hypothetical protein